MQHLTMLLIQLSSGTPKHKSANPGLIFQTFIHPCSRPCGGVQYASVICCHKMSHLHSGSFKAIAFLEPNGYCKAQLGGPLGSRMWLFEKHLHLWSPLHDELNGEEQSFGKGSRDTPSFSPQLEVVCQCCLKLLYVVNPPPSHLPYMWLIPIVHITSWIASLPTNHGQVWR